MNKRYDELFDTLIKLAGEEILEEKAIEMPTEEDIQGIEVDLFQLDKKVERLMNDEARKVRIKKAMRVTLRVAAILLAVVMASTVVIMSSEALRVEFLNLFHQQNDISTEIDISEESVNDEMVSGFVEPKYMTEGYELAEVIQVGDIYAATYIGVDDVFIRIEQGKGDVGISLDNEDISGYETEIDGNQVFVNEGKEEITIIISTQNYNYTIIGSIETSELLKIAGSYIK